MNLMRMPWLVVVLAIVLVLVLIAGVVLVVRALQRVGRGPAEDRRPRSSAPGGPPAPRE